MKTHQKTALSLLLAVVVFSAFAVLSYSGLFEYIEANFYDPRVRDRVETTLDRGAEVLDTYHENNRERFGAILTEPAVRSVYRVNQSRDDILARRNFFARLEEQVTSLAFVRFVDSDAERLWYSTLPSDVSSETDFRREYAPLAELGGEILPAELVLPADGSPDIVLDPEGNHFVYRFPVEDEFGIVQGTALFYVGPNGATDALVRNDVIEVGQRLVIAGDERIIANYAPRFGSALREETVSVDLDRAGGGNQSVLTSGEGVDYLVFSQPLESVGRILYLSPLSAFRMNEVMRWVLLSSTFLTVFLLAFLILNIRQDPEVVLTERIKRFQINLLRELFETGDKPDWEQKRVELEERKEEVNREIKRGIGRLSPSKEKEVDDLLEKSWDEILNVIGNRTRVEDRTDRIDLERLEDMIEKVMSNFASLPARGDASGGAAGAGAGTAGAAGRQQAPVAQGGEAPQTSAAAAPAHDARGPGDSVESSEPSREPVEVEEVGEDEGEELESLEEAEEPAEELEEAGELEEVDEEAEELEEAEEPGEADFTAGMKPVEVEEVGEDEGEELESLEEAEMEDLAEFGALEETTKLEQMSGRETVEAARAEERAAGETPSDEELLRDLSNVREEWEQEQVDTAAEQASVAPPDSRDSAVAGEQAEFGELEELEEPEEAEEPEEVRELQEAEPAELEPAEPEPEPAEELGELEPADLEELEPEGETVEELETVEPERDEEPEPLQPSSPRASGEVRMSDWFSFARHESTPLEDEDVEEAELIEELEEIEEQEPAEADVLEEEADTGEPYRLEDELIVFTSAAETNNEYFEILSLEPGNTDTEDNSESDVFTADGEVVQIDERVYESAHDTPDEEVRELVESIVGPEDEEDAAGIDELLAPGGGLDLLPVGQREEELITGGESTGAGRTPTITPRGLDYDAILSRYPANEGGILKSLIEFTRSWGARAAGVLLPHDGELRLEYSLAVEERCRRDFVVPSNSDVYRHVLSHRSILLAREPLHRFRSFRGLCSEAALAYIGEVILIPIVFRGQEGYLFLGVRDGATGIRELLANAGMSLPEASPAAAAAANS